MLRGTLAAGRRFSPCPSGLVIVIDHQRIRLLAAQELSPYKISADLAERGVRLSHVSVRKILRRAA